MVSDTSATNEVPASPQRQCHRLLRVFEDLLPASTPPLKLTFRLPHLQTGGIARGTCTNISQAPKLDPHKTTPTLHCRSCSSVLGERSPTLSAIKLFKPRLAIQTSPSTPPTTHDPTIFINASLLLSIDSLATRKFILHSNLPSTLGLHLWVFNPDIHYSSSITGPTPHRASKIFYRSTPTPLTLLESHPTNLEEMILPSSILDEFTASLTASTNILPESARKFQEWSVGLLGRYERNPICGMEQQPLANKLGEMPEWPEGLEKVIGIEEMEGHEGLFE
jgi:hypothetical protein